nr:ABC-F family ATP-binding cassette domain-containing protein [Bacteroidales bacterium]
KSFGDLILFENISFQLGREQKIGLVGKNGAGKSTLFKILFGIESPDSGNITFHKDIRIGFLEQEPEFDSNKTVFEQVFNASGEIMEIVSEYEQSLLANDSARLQAASEMMDIKDAWNYEHKIKQILSKLKIDKLDENIARLSGGQKKRVALAQTLITEPDLLILDEPTNHLDIEMIEWLEEYLAKPGITLLMVTHDRYFLDRVCNEIAEIDNCSLFRYQGNYTKYLEKREERLANDKINAEKARNLLRKELDWIRRMPKARTTKSKSRIDNFYDLQDKAKQRPTDKQVNLNIATKRLGNKIIEAKNISKSFGDLKVINNFTYIFNRFEKTGIIGNNGTGKSTLLNLLTGALKADSGTIEVGETITFGYFRQEGISFDNSMKVIDAVRNIADIAKRNDGSSIDAMRFLNYFLFPPETQNKYIGKLSGGEKRRLYLATVLMLNPNFLVLDEPTNDLDILTLNALEEYLLDFKGCVIVVSHDRYFMDKIVSHLFVCKGRGEIKDYPGNYTDYRNYAAALEKQKALAEKNTRKPEKQDPRPINQLKKKLSYKEQQEFDKLSIEIQQLEIEFKNIEELLYNGNPDYEETILKSDRAAQIKELIENKTNRWLELSDLAG